MGKQFSSSSRKHRVKNAPKFTATDKRNFSILIIMLLAAAGTIYWLGSEKPATPPFLSAAEAQGTLPATVPPRQFNHPMINEAYTAALKLPKVVAQQPCYCGCDRTGHRSLLDCFRSTHAAGCDICVKEAILAGRMHEQGKTVMEIRNAIMRGDWRNVN
jgi:hypothetical protein